MKGIIMAKVEIFSGPMCPYCEKAKTLFNIKGVAYEEKDVRANPEYMKEMKTRVPNARTIPQIFIDDKHIGGFDDADGLNNSGELDKLLGL